MSGRRRANTSCSRRHRKSAGDHILGADVLESMADGACSANSSTNMDRSRITCTRVMSMPRRSDKKGKPEGLLLPQAIQCHPKQLPHTYMGLNPGRRKEDVFRCLENWNKGERNFESLARVPALNRDRVAGQRRDSSRARLRSSPTSRRSTAMSSGCSNPKLKGASWTGVCSRRCTGRISPQLRVPGRHAGWEANVDPEFGKHNKVFSPTAGSAREEMAEEWLPRSGGSLTGRLYYSGQGTHGSFPKTNGDYSRQRCIRTYPDRRLWDIRNYGVNTGHDRFRQMTQDELFVTVRGRAGRRAHYQP